MWAGGRMGNEGGGIDHDSPHTLSHQGQPLPKANGWTILYSPGEAVNLEPLRAIKPTVLAGTHLHASQVSALTAWMLCETENTDSPDTCAKRPGNAFILSKPLGAHQLP